MFKKRTTKVTSKAIRNGNKNENENENIKAKVKVNDITSKIENANYNKIGATTITTPNFQG